MAARGNRKKAQAVAREERRNLVMNLSLAGASIYEIAALPQIKVTPNTVAKDIRARLKEAAQMCPNTAIYRELHRQRINRMMSLLWPRVNAGDDAAVDRMLKLLDREAKVLGLDAPVQQEVKLRGSGKEPVRVQWMGDDDNTD